MSASISALIPELQPWCQALLDETGRLGLQPRLTSTRRSQAEQQRLYRRYLAGQQPYYVAPPGTSPHEFGWAFDMVCNDLEYAGSLWLSWGGEWGGRSTRGHSYDPVHFQYPGFTQVPQQAESTSYVRRVTQLAEEVGGILDPSGGFGVSLLEQQFTAPERLYRVVTGQSSYLQELEDYLRSIF